VSYSIEEAIAASHVGRARGFNARGEAVFTANGPGFGLSRRKQRKRRNTTTVLLNWPENKVGKKWPGTLNADWSGHRFHRLNDLPKRLRSQLDNYVWLPDEEVSVVEMIASA